jgi:hypothetical protein
MSMVWRERRYALAALLLLSLKLESRVISEAVYVPTKLTLKISPAIFTSSPRSSCRRKSLVVLTDEEPVVTDTLPGSGSHSYAPV